MVTKSIDIKDATILSTGGHPADPEPTTVLVLSAPLTVLLADALKCRDMSFTINNNARAFEGKFGLPLELGEADAEIVLPDSGGGRNTLRPHKIWKFRIGHETDLKLEVEFRAHFKGAADAQVIGDLLQGMNQSPFTVSIVSLQGELFGEKSAETKDDGAAGGKRVVLSDGKVGTLFEAQVHNGEGSGDESSDQIGQLPDDTTHFDASNEGEKEEVEYPIYTEGPDPETGIYLATIPRITLETKLAKGYASIELLHVGVNQWVSCTAVEVQKSANFSALMKNDRIFPSKELAIAWEAWHAQNAARPNINTTKGQVSKTWLAITEWFGALLKQQVAKLELDGIDALVELIEQDYHPGARVADMPSMQTEAVQ